MSRHAEHPIDISAEVAQIEKILLEFKKKYEGKDIDTMDLVFWIEDEVLSIKKIQKIDNMKSQKILKFKQALEEAGFGFDANTRYFASSASPSWISKATALIKEKKPTTTKELNEIYDYVIEYIYKGS